MRIITLATLPRAIAVAALLSMTACASHNATNFTISEAVAAPDDTKVVVTGGIVEQTDANHLLLRDSTGQIMVKADEDLLGKVKFAPDSQLRVYGEIERDSERSVLIAKSVSVVR